MAAGGGVEFLLELQAKLDGVSGMVKALSDVESAALKGGDALKKLEHHSTLGGRTKEWFKDFGKSASHGFVSMFAAEAAWDTFKEGAHEAIALTKEVISELVGGAAEAERMNNVFENVAGVAEARELSDLIEEMSERTEFTDDQFKAFAAPLMDAGMKGEQLEAAMAAVGDAAARSVDKMEGASGAVSALSRISMSGVLDNRTLRMLKLNGKEVYEQMADNLGMSQAALKKKLGEGKIAADVVMNEVLLAMEKKGGGILGSAAAVAGKTLSAQLVHVGEIPDKFADELKDSPGMIMISEALEGMWKALSPDSPEGQRILAGIEEMMGSVGSTLKSLDWKAVASGISDIAKSIGPTLDAMLKLGSAAKTAFDAVATVMRYTPNGIVANFAADLAGGRVVNKQSEDQLDKLGFEVRDGKVIKKGTPPMYDELGRIVRGGVGSEASLRGYENTGDKVGAALASGVEGGARKGLGINSPSRVFQEIGVYSAEGFERGFSRENPGAVVEATVVPPPSFDSSRVAVGGAGTSVGGISMPVYVTVAQTNADPEQIAQEVRSQVSTELIALFEQVALQAGA